MRRLAPLLLASLFSACAHAGGIPLGGHRTVDLTHAFGPSTLYWPTATTGFALNRLSYGETPGGYFYSANAFCAPEHGGTHLDAPIHFAAGKQTADQIPLDRLVAPAVVIDVRQHTASNPDYRLTAADVLEWERRHGRIAPGTIVLLHTGCGRFWPDRKRYFGDDRPGDASNLHFPSYGEESARLLVQERRVAALGVDAASIDYGQSKDFLVHRVAAAENVPGLENLISQPRPAPAHRRLRGRPAHEDRERLGRPAARHRAGETVDLRRRRRFRTEEYPVWFYSSDRNDRNKITGRSGTG